MTTNKVLLDFADQLIRPAPSLTVEIFMLCDIVQCMITFAGCTRILVQKGRMSSLQLCALRRGPHGTFIVPNCVILPITGTIIYELGWAGFCAWIIYVQKSGRPLIDWLWYIPLPWQPLALFAFLGSYGFMMTCSPRSPISNLMVSPNHRDSTQKLSWYYLPLPRSAKVMNTYLILVSIIMVVYNVVVQFLGGTRRDASTKPGHDLWGTVLSQQHSEEWLAQAPSPELLAMVKLAWFDLCNVYRYCCLALASYLAIVGLTVVHLALYSVPNQIFLIKHLCRIFPDPVPDNCKGSLLNQIRMVLTVGWPRNLKQTKYMAYKKTWMMTMVGHSQALLLLAAVLSFTVPPFFLVLVPWTNMLTGKSSDRQVMFILAYVICVAVLVAAWVTGMSTIMSFDIIFRTVAGMGTAGSGFATSQISSDHHADSGKVLKGTVLPLVSTNSGSKDSQSTASPGMLRAQPSFAASSTGSMHCKMESVDDYELGTGGNKLFVHQTTTVTVEENSVVTALEEPASVPMYPHPFNQASYPASRGADGRTSRNSNPFS